MRFADSGARYVSETLTVAADPGKVARLEAVKADPAAPQVIFHRVADGETLKEIAQEWQIPRGAFVLWFTTKFPELYDAALKARADDLAHEALAIADEQSEVVKENGQTYDPDVPRDKLRVDTRLKLASQWDRARYGAKDTGPAGGGITVVVDRSCGGKVEITAGGSTLTVGGVSQEREISSTDASLTEAVGEI